MLERNLPVTSRGFTWGPAVEGKLALYAWGGLYLCVRLTVSLLVALCLVSDDPPPHCSGTSSPPSHTAITPAPLGLSVLAKSHLEPEGRPHSWQ